MWKSINKFAILELSLGVLGLKALKLLSMKT